MVMSCGFVITGVETVLQKNVERQIQRSRMCRSLGDEEQPTWNPTLSLI